MLLFAVSVRVFLSPPASFLSPDVTQKIPSSPRPSLTLPSLTRTLYSRSSYTGSFSLLISVPPPKPPSPTPMYPACSLYPSPGSLSPLLSIPSTQAPLNPPTPTAVSWGEGSHVPALHVPRGRRRSPRGAQPGRRGGRLPAEGERSQGGGGCARFSSLKKRRFVLR